MNRILTLYIARQILQSILIVMLALVGIGALFYFIGQVKHLDKAHVDIMDIVLSVVYMVPGSLYETFPPAVLIGSLLALGGMASHSELIAIRAATVSKFQISLMVALTGIVLMVFIVLIGEFVLPISETKKDQMKAKIKSNISKKELNNVWLKDDAQFIRVGKIVSDNEIHDLRIYEVEDNKIVRSINAAKAIKQDIAWQVLSADIVSYDAGIVNVAKSEFLYFDWKFDLGVVRSLQSELSVLSMQSLSGYIEYLETNNLDSDKHRLSFWLKLLSPLTVMVMLLLALPFAFGSLRSMPAGNLIVIGLVIGLVYYITSGIASNLGYLYGFPPFVNAFAPSLVFVLFALFLMLKQKF